jgi:hypothetical protein
MLVSNSEGCCLEGLLGAILLIACPDIIATGVFETLSNRLECLEFTGRGVKVPLNVVVADLVFGRNSLGWISFGLAPRIF